MKTLYVGLKIDITLNSLSRVNHNSPRYGLHSFKKSLTEEKMNKVITESCNLIKKSGLQYVVCGGYAIDLFLNKKIRRHTDFDITIFDEDRKEILNFMLAQGWDIYDHIWDNQGTDHLIPIKSPDDERAMQVDMVWAVKPGCTLLTVTPKEGEDGIFVYKMTSTDITNADFIEICFDKKDNQNFICNKEINITRPLDKAILYNGDIPYLSPEITLYHKSAPVYMTWLKTIFDFYHTAHLLNDESKDWLIKSLIRTYPDGHEWVERLQKNF